MSARTVLIAAASLFSSGIIASAQMIDVLHTFSANTSSNLDGAGPATELVLSGNTLYGAAGDGANGSGTNNFGTVFSLNTDGSGFTVLHTFSGVTLSGTLPPVQMNTDGFGPRGTLVLAGDILYGVASAGGVNGSGTVFSLSTNGQVFNVLHMFETNVPTGTFPASTSTNSEGAAPNSLILVGDTLYGTAQGGGTNGLGTLFSIRTNGAGFTVLHTFTSKTTDGKNPQSRLAFADGMLYGTTPLGGANGSGIVYSLTTNGANFRVVHNFPESTVTETGPYLEGLLCSGSTLFGTATAGGVNLTGFIFSVNTNGANFATIYNFSTNGSITNIDGANPEGGLILLGDTLYGTANAAGTHNNGTIFSVNTNGSAFNTLWSFSKLNAATNLDGVHPRTGFALGGAFLYGTGYFGGANANGTVFSLGVTPIISRVALSGNDALLTGMNALAGHAYTVLTSTNVSSPLNLWSPITTNTLAGGGPFNFTATNAVLPGAAQQFYLLQTQ
jgi:uncharacterized repeat protein (TIGR03803 family)